MTSVTRHAAPLNPRYPERICWGCDKFCPAEELACGNGTIRTPHPAELFGVDWLTWCEQDSKGKRLRPERGAKSPSESERGWGPASSE